MTAQILTNIRFQFLNPADGKPLAGGKIYSYEVGTTTPKATWTTEDKSTENTKPIILNAAGYADIAIDGEYKFLVTDSNDVVIDTVEPVTSVQKLIADIYTAAKIKELYQENDNVMGVIDFTDKAKVVALGDQSKETSVHVLSPDGGIFNHVASSSYTDTATDACGIFISDGSASGGWERIFDCDVNIRWFTTGDFSVAADNMAAITLAIVSLRNYAENRLDTIGGSVIVMYRSKVLRFPRGVFPIPPDSFQITQDMGLTLKGEGSRRYTNAIQGATTLLIRGVSSGYGIKLYRNGARSMHVEDLDLCYEDSGFTGHLFDAIDCPGLTMKRVYLGTFGITDATRKQTASSLIRVTYDEFYHFEDCVFDGAIDGWWSDDLRTELGNQFGGFNTVFVNCTFYDFTGKMIRHDGNRTRDTLNLISCAFNPINIDCDTGVDLNNIDGIKITTCIFVPSTSHKPTNEWLTLNNCTGVLESSSFNDLAKAGTLSGNLTINSNRVYCTDGFTLINGVINGKSNEFSQGSSGWTLAPVGDSLSVDIGPDVFKPEVINSYNIPADSTLLAGRINYDRARDGSVSKFTNASGRVRIESLDGKAFSEPGLAVTLSMLDTGRTVRATGTASQVFTLPSPVPGCKLQVFKASSHPLKIQAATGTLYTGVGPTKTSMSAIATDIGGWVELEAWDTYSWIVKSSSGAWVYE